MQQPASPVPKPAKPASKRGERDPFVELAQDEKGLWHWCLWTKNGRAIAMNTSGFERQNDAWKSFLALQDVVRGGITKQVTQNYARGTSTQLKKTRRAEAAVMTPPRPEPPPMANPIMQPDPPQNDDLSSIPD